MKRKKVLIAAVLLFSLLFTGFSLNVPPRAENTEAAPAAAPQTLSSVQTPASAPAAQPSAAAAGRVTPTNVKTDMFSAKFEGDRVAGSGEAVDGVYRFTASQTDGEAWHVKLECNYPTVAGRDYYVTYRFRSDVDGKVKFGDFQEFAIHKGENTLTGIMIASGGTSYLDLQLGMLPPFTIDFTEVEVKEYADEVEYENALTAPVNYEREALVYERHDEGYTPILTRGENEVSVYYFATAWDTGVWKSRLYINTGLIPEMGVRYRITADVTSDEDMPFEVLFNDGDREKGYGALYGQELVANETKHLEAVITGGEGDELMLQFSLGEAPEDATVRVSNLGIEIVKDHYTNALSAAYALDKTILTGNTIFDMIPDSYTTLPLGSFSFEGTDSVHEYHDGGYVVDLEEGSDSATLKISKAPEKRDVWNVRLYAETGVTLEAGETYQISFDLASTADQANYEVCLDGDSGDAIYGKLFRSLTAGGTDHVEHTVTPDVSHGPLTIRLQLGKTDTTAGNNITISNIKITKAGAETATELTLPEPFYPDAAESSTQENSFFLEANSGAAATMTGDGNSATATVTTPGADWNVKFYARPEYALEAGQNYTVSLKVTNASGCTVCYKNKNTGAEDGFGTEAITANEQTITHSIAAKENGTLEILLKIGNVAADTAVTVSEVQIKKETTDFIPDELSGFGYPVVTEGSTEDKSFSLENNSGAESTLSGDGKSATVTVTKPGADWNIKLYANTGVTLEAGKTYQISAKVSGAGGWKICYKRAGQGENDFDGAVSFGETVVNTVTPSESGQLEIMLKLGEVAANGSVTISDIQIAESKAAPVNVMPSPLSYPGSFFLENNSGAESTMDGAGGSATVTVTKPGADWNIKLYANTGVTLEAGKTYQISAKVSGAGGWKICFKRAGQGENDFDGTVSFGDTVVNTVTPGVSGTLEVMLMLGAVAENGSVTISDVQVYELQNQFVNVDLGGFAYPVTTPGSADLKSFSLENNSGADSTLGGDGSSATVTVTKPGADWNIKLYANTGLALEAGKTYRISAKVSGAGGWKICYKRAGKGENDFDGSVEFGETVVNTVTAGESGTLEIMLKLGEVAANGSVTISEIRVEEFKTGELDVMPESFAYPVTSPGGEAPNCFALENNNGAAASLSGDGSSATATVTTPGADWHIKLYGKPGLKFEAGKSYRISLDVSGAKGCSVSFKNTDTGNEEGFGSESISADSQTVTHIVKAEQAGPMEILLKIGNVAANTAVKVSNVKIEELSYGEGESVLPSFSYDSEGYVSRAADDGYITTLEQSSDSATLNILQAPSSDRNPWNVKMFVRTGFKPQSGKGYRVSFDVNSAKAQNLFEVFYDGNSEAAYGALYERTLPAGKKTFSYTILPGDSKGELTLQLRFGKTNGTDGNSYTVSNLKIEEVSFLYTRTPETKDVVELVAQPGYVEKLSKTPDKATLRIERTPTSGMEPWKSKLFIYTGVTLKAGQKYRISMVVKSIIPAPFEVCFNNGDVEKGLGAIYGLLSSPTGQRVEYVTYPKEDTKLVMQLSLGNCAAPNTLMVSNVAVEKAAAINLVSDTIYSF